MPISSYIPAKETWVKIFSSAATGAGAIVSGIGASKGNHALANVGAVGNLAGNFLNDVPETWLKKRADKTYIELLKLVEPSIRHAVQRQPALLDNFDTNNREDREVGARCARFIQFFANHALRYEIARVENFPSVINAICASVAFGISAHDGWVAGAGVFGVLLGSAIGLIVAEATIPSLGEEQDAPQPGATLNGAPGPARIRDYENVEQMQPPPKPSHTAAGDYKGRVAVMKFFGGVVAGVGCAVGLAIARSERDSNSWRNYVDNDFFSAVTNAVAAGAAWGSMFATCMHRVATVVQSSRGEVAEMFFAAQNIERLNIHDPHEGTPQVPLRVFEHVCMGRVV